MTQVETVRGLVEVGELGFTLPHEHLVLRSPGVFEEWPGLWDREREIERAGTALNAAWNVGVRTIFDLTTVDLGRDIALVQAVSARTRVNIVVATGVWCEPPRYFVGNRIDRIADLFVRDIQEGIRGTPVRAGVIKAATRGASSEENEQLLRACARAHVRTRLPILTHHDVGYETGTWQQQVFASEGADLSRVVIGHAGDTDDLEYLRTILERGSFIGMDRFGVGMYLTEEKRVEVVAELCRLGYARQLLLSHDASSFMDTLPARRREKFPNWHFRYISEMVIPRLRTQGVSEEDIHTMTVENPARLMTKR